MALVVDKIKCVKESGEAFGSDQIYLIVFQGRTVLPFLTGLNSVGQSGVGSSGEPAFPFPIPIPWNDFDTGETAKLPVRIASTNGDSLYAVMMVEQDNGKDIAGTAVVSAWNTQTALAWKAHMLSLLGGGLPTNTESAKAAGFEAIQSTLNGLASIYMEFPKGDDDVLGVKRVTITTAGQSQTIRFRSDAEDATYDVTFKHTTAA